MATFMKQNLTEVAGPDCNIENALIRTAENLAVLHSNTFVGTNSDLVNELESFLDSAQWVNSKGKESFDKTKTSMEQVLGLSLKHKNGLNPENTPVANLIQASVDKINFEEFGQTANLFNREEGKYSGTPFSLTMNQLHFNDMLWQKKDQSVVLCDFEFIGYGPCVTDLCRLLLGASQGFRVAHQEKVIEAYFEKLKEIGTIDTTIYTIERL